ncbi:putative coiled-coil domain-containing protein 55 [Erysiphe necator]|uniref:Putative coiled-coil domain-containing protein 55 n=1 Tax=Uncinula necator TaxID=52586 RepID=A0A0B1P408_UNCNE|nr:putative coiled-coil domain-containing protein 55 [Erysiphe necator]
MDRNKLKYGLNIKKKNPNPQSKSGRRNIIFEEEENLDDTTSADVEEENICEIGGLDDNKDLIDGSFPKKISHSKKDKVPASGVSQKKFSLTNEENLSASFTSKKHENFARNLDANIYEYDAVYDSLKRTKRELKDDKDRKPRYMANLIAAAAVRKRDATIAEEKKLQRERDAEGDEYADKEKFVTSAYKKQQEENRRLEQEERTREELDAKNNVGTGMLNFYKNVLEKEEKKHAEIVKAVDERLKNGLVETEEIPREKTAAEIAREINAKKAGSIIVNDEGDVIDKRQLLTGGLNINSKKYNVSSKTNSHGKSSNLSQGPGRNFVGSGGGKEAMRQRQSRMIEAQLEQVSKRAFEQEEEAKLKIERASKSRKTEAEIMGAKERYLARKREAELAKKKSPDL